MDAKLITEARQTVALEAGFPHNRQMLAALLSRVDALEAALRPICSEFAQQHPLIKAGRELLEDR